MTAWEILAGVPLFGDELRARGGRFVLRGIEDGHLRPDIARLPNDVPEPVKDILQQCWVPRQDGRPRMADVVRVLEAALAALAVE